MRSIIIKLPDKLIKNLLFCCLLIGGLFSCKSPLNDVIGTYIANSNLNTKHRFILNADSTFNYSYIVIGDIEGYSSGIWKRIDRNTIILNSDIQSNIIPLDIEITPSNNKNPMINVELIVPEKDTKEYRCTPYFPVIGGYIENFLPDRGSYSYEETNYYSNNHELFYKVSKEPREFIPGRGKVEYYLLPTEHKTIITNDGDIVNVTVIVPDSLFSYRVFNNEKIKIKGDKLIFKDKENNNKTIKLHIKD